MIHAIIFIVLYHVSGATIKYKPKAGQCQQVCCDGAGGELTVVSECTPADKCEGFEADEKKEDEHCPGESKGTCTEKCKGGKLYKFYREIVADGLVFKNSPH